MLILPQITFGTALDNLVTSLWTGNATERSIATGQNLSSAGGLVWIKDRGATNRHVLVDTVRGVNNILESDTDTAEQAVSQYVNAFNTNGYTVGTNGTVNNTSNTYVGWSFKQGTGFLSIVEYSGDGTSSQTVNHSLGSAPGLMLVKRTDSNASWQVYHRDLGNTKGLVLNTTAAATTSSALWNNTSPTSTQFTVGSSSNASGSNNYIAYLFAHATGQNVYCGSYTGNGSSSGPSITDPGFSPKFVLIKNSDTSSAATLWIMMDTTRGIDQQLYADDSRVEVTSNYIDITASGFDVVSANDGVNKSGDTMVYIAIG